MLARGGILPRLADRCILNYGGLRESGQNSQLAPAI